MRGRRKWTRPRLLWAALLRSTVASPRRASQRGQSGAEEEERGRPRYVRHVRSHLERINKVFADSESAGAHKVPVFDIVELVDCSGRQRNGSRIGRKLHIDKQIIGMVGEQQPIADRAP